MRAPAVAWIILASHVWRVVFNAKKAVNVAREQKGRVTDLSVSIPSFLFLLWEVQRRCSPVTYFTGP